MFEKLLEGRKHIPPHRIWTFLKGKSRLSVLEHLHALECDHCRSIFQVCFKSATFGAALKALGHDQEQHLA